MKHIEDNILLLGLIATIIPFKYENNTVSANFLAYIELADLEKAKAELEELKKNSSSDEEKIELSDEIYFIDKIIESLGMK